MSLKVESVFRGSIGDVLGIRPGDRLVEINGHTIRDIIDYQFYSADDVIDCTFLRNRKVKSIRFRQEECQNSGLDFEPMRLKKCGNRCIFCFVDQNPKGMRLSLYFKDEDYRLSFIHGNYVTLTQVSRNDLKRIVEQRLSPLYVSIHAVDLKIRKNLLGLKQDDRLLGKIRFLINNGIELHGQIVLCPGINDGKVLKESLETLSSFFPGVHSIAVVPVGLTRHRQGLPKLRGYDSDSARIVLEEVENVQKGFKRKLGQSFVYLADEFYLLGRISLPCFEHYEDFWQLENGVGLTRSFLKTFDEASKEFPEKLDRSRRFVIVTGALAEPVIESYVLPVLRKIKNLHIHIRVVYNRFYGDSITVSGLLTGQDIIDAFRGDENDADLLLPHNCLNSDEFFLDDLSINDLTRVLKRRIIALEDFKNFWKIAR